MAKENIDKSKDRLEQLIEVIVNTSEAKGWGWKIESIDEKSRKYATVLVSRSINFDQVEAIFEITVDDEAFVSFQQTSFHGYGLQDLQQAITRECLKLPGAKKPQKETKEKDGISELQITERLIRHFHSAARQLRNRYDDRQPFEMNDEYDLQDLLHALLRGFFDDIRAEEYSPSYAGGSSRMDFLLKKEKIVIETKFANPKLRDRQVGEELIIDIARYKTHQDCKNLICFVYDPNGHIKNPSGLEADLSGMNGNLNVKVIVVSV